MLTLDAQRIDRQTLGLAYNLAAMFERSKQYVGRADALNKHPTNALRNFSEWLKNVVGLLETVLIVDVEISRH